MATQPSLTLEQMIRLLKKRTKVTNDDAWFVSELNDAQDWTWQRFYRSNPQIQINYDTEGTLSADSQSLDLTTALSTTVWGIQQLWVKGVNDTYFIPAVYKDANDPEMLALDQISVQVIQPVYYTIYNFNQIRFGNKLPSQTKWRADWIGEPPLLSLDSNAANTSVPPTMNYPTLARATAVIYDSVDDTRAGSEANNTGWYGVAERRVLLAIQNTKRRQFSTKMKTRSYPGSGSNSIWPPARQA